MKLWNPHKSDQHLYTHSENRCAGSHCPVHNVSDHHMKDWPQYYRGDLGCTERICIHGVGHPDPDDIMWDSKVHGCDGCCQVPVHKHHDIKGYYGSWVKKAKTWVRRLLCEDYHHEIAEHYVQVMEELETAELEVVRLQEIVRLTNMALDIYRESGRDQEKIITELKIYAGLQKRRGRKKKNP